MTAARMPRQQRAIETRRRLYEAALDEYERVGVEAARVEDIVAAAGASWGSFFRYVPRKEDVLLEIAAERAAEFARSVAFGIRRGDPIVRIAAGSIARAGTVAVKGRPKLQNAFLQEAAAHPQHVAAYLTERGEPSWVDTMTVLFEEGQRRREVRDDYPPRAMAQVVMAALTAAQRGDLTWERPTPAWRGRADRYALLALDLSAFGFIPRPDSS